MYTSGYDGEIYRSGKRDSNPRPLAWEANALPTELLPLIDQHCQLLIYFFILTIGNILKIIV